MSELLGKLEHILNDNSEVAKYPLGVMTSENRNIWAGLRTHIVQKSSQNKKSLSEIDSALFVLCLDDIDLGSDPVPVTRSFLHSDACNRYDHFHLVYLFYLFIDWLISFRATFQMLSCA